ncbi:unnamed protein product [Triticum turgidum subsp. durum]|uniref:GRAM domain-containing protein n=1 Tax=Triticum turgidum subsp. durum TaxID=4567 RepID=A0A9R0Z6V1_TRITD|nr:unnamed protein product [Triticum turgidum subsp. durum]
MVCCMSDSTTFFSQTVKTGPSFTEAAMGRLAQGTKVLAEGGYEKIFKQTFEILPDEQLKMSYACYLSTSAGPVMGVMYISTAKIAFCSDNPLSYKAGNKTEWSYYKVVIPLHQLRTANPSVSKVNPAEKYIQVVSVEGHEFWFMGFLMYDKAVSSLQEALDGARCMKSRGPSLEEIDRTVGRLDGESAPVKYGMPDGAEDDATDEEMAHGLVLLVAQDAPECGSPRRARRATVQHRSKSARHKKSLKASGLGKK